MSSMNVPDARLEKVAFGKLWQAGLLAAAASVVVNVVMRLVAGAAIEFPAAIGVPAVVASSVIGTVAATIVFALLGKFTRRPLWLFRIIAVVALVISMFGPLQTALGANPSIPDAGAPVGLVLALMHTAVGVISVGLLTTMGRERQ